MVQVRHSNPEHAAELANGYVELAIQQAKQRLKADVEAEHMRVQLDLESQLASLLQRAEQERKSELIKLTEALWIAESLGLEQPIFPDGKAREMALHMLIVICYICVEPKLYKHKLKF